MPENRPYYVIVNKDKQYYEGIQGDQLLFGYKLSKAWRYITLELARKYKHVLSRSHPYMEECTIVKVIPTQLNK